MRKLTIEEMRQLAARRNGRCLSKAYVDAHTKLEWECANGHRWWAKPNDIQQGRWCPKGQGRGRKIEDLRAVAVARGGRCLSRKFAGVMRPHLWECMKGHQWWARPVHVERGSWCPVCAKTQKKTIEEMRELAASRGGGCLSGEYMDSKKPLHWECSGGHQWWANLNTVQQGRWCRRCANLERKSKALKAKVKELAE